MATICTHFVVLFMLIFFPEVVMGIGDAHRTDIPTHIYVKSLMYMVVFYVNYYFIVDHCFNGENSKTRFALYNTVLFVVVMTVCYILWESEPPHHHPLVHHGHGPGIHPLPPPEGHSHLSETGNSLLQEVAHQIIRYVRDAVMVILVMFLALALKLRSRCNAIQHYKERIDAMQTEAELENLKTQLNPHFLFNTLNSIYALIAINREKAQWAVHKLSSMLRYVLYESTTAVPLGHEVKFIDSYIALMCMRFGDKMPITVSVDVAADMDDAEIAPLMFVTIIENVFKHGVAEYKDKPVSIKLSADEGIVRCYTSNYYKAKEPASLTTGIGLKNLRRRLDLIYGKNAELRVDATGDAFVVELVINLNNSTNNK